jgi:hypothetical protein
MKIPLFDLTAKAWMLPLLLLDSRFKENKGNYSIPYNECLPSHTHTENISNILMTHMHIPALGGSDLITVKNVGTSLY